VDPIWIAGCMQLIYHLLSDTKGVERDLTFSLPFFISVATKFAMSEETT
jgi:hypothetical protein